MANTTKQLPRRRYVRHQAFDRLRKTDSGRFQKFLNEQATRLGAARRGIRDLLMKLGVKSAEDIDNASTAASLGASRITGTTSTRFAAVRHTDPGAIVMGLPAADGPLVFAPRMASGVALLLSGNRITRGTGAWDESTFPAGTTVRLILSGATSGIYTVDTYPSTSGMDLVEEVFDGVYQVHASSGIVEAARCISGGAGLDALFPGDPGAMIRTTSGVVVNSGDYNVVDNPTTGVIILAENIVREAVASGEFLVRNYLYTENAAAAGDEISQGNLAAGKELRIRGVDELGEEVDETAWLAAFGDGTDGGVGAGGGYLLSGAVVGSAQRIVNSGEAEIQFSCIVSGAADWATSGFEVADRFVTSGISAAIDAGGPYTIRKIAPSGVLLEPGAFAAGTNVTDNSHLVYEVAQTSR